MALKIKKQYTTAAKKTWGGQWFPQSSFYMASFVMSEQLIAPKSRTTLILTVNPKDTKKGDRESREVNEGIFSIKKIR